MFLQQTNEPTDACTSVRLLGYFLHVRNFRSTADKHVRTSARATDIELTIPAKKKITSKNYIGKQLVL